MSQRILMTLATAAAMAFIVVGSAEARRVCAKNSGNDPVGVRAGHAMYWLDRNKIFCFDTNATNATIQNDQVRECLERDVTVDLREHACLIADGVEGVCVPVVKTLPLFDDCQPG